MKDHVETSPKTPSIASGDQNSWRYDVTKIERQVFDFFVFFGKGAPFTTHKKPQYLILQNFANVTHSITIQAIQICYFFVCKL